MHHPPSKYQVQIDGQMDGLTQVVPVKLRQACPALTTWYPEKECKAFHFP